jgi:hypothetical protein
VSKRKDGFSGWSPEADEFWDRFERRKSMEKFNDHLRECGLIRRVDPPGTKVDQFTLGEVIPLSEGAKDLLKSLLAAEQDEDDEADE